MSEDATPGRVRLDKWLWAARFFKTRSLAADAVEGGRVQVNDERVKRARLVQAGDAVRIRQGPYEFHVVVRAVSERRGSAAIAATLYEERAEAKVAREELARQVRAQSAHFRHEEGRPSKKERRDLERFRDGRRRD